MQPDELGIDEKRAASLKAIAKAAAELNTKTDAMRIILDGIRKVPEQLQMMIDSIVAMQEEFPMPREGWEQFVRDVEYTNEKHGLNLQIRKLNKSGEGPGGV